MAFEIALTRIYSVLLRSPYVFLVVSVAIGGLGLGAMTAENEFFARLTRLSLLEFSLPLSLIGRSIVTAVLLAPIGFLLAFPFLPVFAGYSHLVRVQFRWSRT